MSVLLASTVVLVGHEIQLTSWIDLITEACAAGGRPRYDRTAAAILDAAAAVLTEHGSSASRPTSRGRPA